VHPLAKLKNRVFGVRRQPLHDGKGENRQKKKVTCAYNGTKADFEKKSVQFNVAVEFSSAQL